MGKEAALLVASGTMGNLIAMLVHCARGTKAVLGSRAHTYLYEAGGAAALGGVVLTPIRNTDDGEFALDELKSELETPARSAFRAARAGRDGKHAQPLRRRGGRSCAHGCGRRTGASPRTRRASRRRANLQRRARARDQRKPYRRACRHGFVLPLQGPRVSGGHDALRAAPVRGTGAPHAQGAGRRNAPGGDNRGGRDCRA